MKNLFPLLYGNNALKERIGISILNNSLSHAYIIEGSDGSGKMFFARQIAAALSCERKNDSSVPLPCGECMMCKKILNNSCPDVTYLDRGNGKTINIEAVRNLRRDTYLVSNEADKKVYIVNDADTMTPQAQNALLIVLEEPPPDVVIMLLCENSQRLLTTVKSRAQTIRMSLFQNEELRKFLISHNENTNKLIQKDPNMFEALLTDAKGSIGRALESLNKKDNTSSIRHRIIIEDIVSAISSRANFSVIREKIFKLSQNRQELAEQLTLFSLALRDLILIRRDENVQLCFYTDRSVVQETADRINMRSLLCLYDATSDALTSLNSNANVILTLTKLTLDIKRNK